MLLSISLGQILPSWTRVNGRNKTCESFSFEKRELTFVIMWVINVWGFFLLPQTLLQRHLFENEARSTKVFSADKLCSQSSWTGHAISFTQSDLSAPCLPSFCLTETPLWSTQFNVGPFKIQKTDMEGYRWILAYLALHNLFYFQTYFTDPDLISDSSTSINQ